MSKKSAPSATIGKTVVASGYFVLMPVILTILLVVVASVSDFQLSDRMILPTLIGGTLGAFLIVSHFARGVVSRIGSVLFGGWTVLLSISTSVFLEEEIRLYPGNCGMPIIGYLFSHFLCYSVIIGISLIFLGAIGTLINAEINPLESNEPSEIFDP